MGDVLFVSILLVFFAVSAGLIRLVDGIVLADGTEPADDVPVGDDGVAA